jgi:flavin-dependent dehydrogenase
LNIVGAEGGLRVAVIGGGFSGLIFSLKLLEAGVDVTLFEEHSIVGYPPHCTGLVSSRVLGFIGAPAFKSTVSRFDGITLSNASSHVTFRVRGGLFKLERVKLERVMLEEALSKGLKAVMGVIVRRVSPRGVVDYGDSSVFDSIIVADGYHGSIHRSLGIGYFNPPVYGVNVEYGMVTGSRRVTVVFDSSISRGFFSWLVEMDHGVLAGLGSGNPKLLARSLRALEEKFGLRDRMSAYGGPVITGPPAEILSIGRVHVVGDAGGLNKPLTGGGLYPNSLAASLAKRMILEGVDVNTALSKSLNAVSSMLRKQYKLAKAVLEGGVIEKILDLLAGEEVGEAVGSVDYDHHEEIPSLAVKRAFWKTVKIGVKTLVKNPALIPRIALAILP